MDDASPSATPRVQHDVIPVFEDFMLELLLLVKCRLNERKRFKRELFKADGLALQKRGGNGCGVDIAGFAFVNIVEMGDVVSFDNVYKRKTREVGIVVVATTRIRRLFGS
jgi:hypothetical protein